MVTEAAFGVNCGCGSSLHSTSPQNRIWIEYPGIWKYNTTGPHNFLISMDLCLNDQITSPTDRCNVMTIMATKRLLNEFSRHNYSLNHFMIVYIYLEWLLIKYVVHIHKIYIYIHIKTFWHLSSVQATLEFINIKLRVPKCVSYNCAQSQLDVPGIVHGRSWLKLYFFKSAFNALVLPILLK